LLGQGRVQFLLVGV
jgi:hypothetical protein